MNKKILFGGIGVIVVGVVVGGWLLFFNNPDKSITENLKDVLPFGQGGSDVGFSADEDKPQEIVPTSDAANLPNLFRLSDVPVAGAVSFIKNGGEIVRYSDRATGHIYDINPVTLEKTKITNNTLPKIYEAYFKKDGSGVIYRSINDAGETVNTSIQLNPPKSTSTDSLYTETSTILRGDIESIAIGDAGKIAYVSNDEGSVNISDFNGGNKKIIFSTPFTKWDIKWSGSNLVLTTKGSSAVSGYSYSLNSQTGAFMKLLGPVNGLTVLRSPDSSRLLYSTSADGPVKTYSVNTQEGGTVQILPSAMPDKCAISHGNSSRAFCASPENPSPGGEPDLWYQGVTHYIDSIWRLNIDTGYAETVVQPKKDFNMEMDVINPFLTPDEDYLIFTNKNDLSLWALKLIP